MTRQKDNKKIALKQGSKSLTYCEWYKKVEKLSNKVRSQIGDLNQIALFLPNSIEFAVAYFSILFLNKVKMSYIAQTLKKQLKIHIKIDSGMGRFGIPYNKGTVQSIKNIVSMKNLISEGIFSHLSSADLPKENLFTQLQIMRFSRIINKLTSAGIMFSSIHLLNSSGIINEKIWSTGYDVRPGALFYGITRQSSNLKLEQVMSVKSYVSYVKDFNKGTTIGYHRSYKLPKRSILATIPVGFADGFLRKLIKGKVILHGNFAPIVGNIGMNSFMVDVTHIDGVNVGDEVVLMGKQGESEITAVELADAADTIATEITCLFGKESPEKLRIVKGSMNSVLEVGNAYF